MSIVRQQLLVEETKKYELMLRERNMSMENQTEAEMGAMQKWGEVTVRDETISMVKEQLEKGTTDSIKSLTRSRICA